MRIKNLTPFPFATKVTVRRPPQREMVVIVRGAFSLRPGEPLVAFEDLLGQGPMKGEEHLPGDDDRTGEASYPGDFADFKLRGEVFLEGTCHPPGAAPVPECPVRFTVGGWSKSLRVVGPRFFSDGLIRVATDPAPFKAMPLRYANAFGGPGYAKNPVGKGHGTLELPNVELPGEPVRSRSDRLEPAGFGPISSSWPQRSGKVGKEYGASWRKTRAPYYAEDFDWSYFNAAPPDQWLDGYLRGDEEIALHNLHPSAPVLSARLPGLRLRAFVKDDRREVREATMSLDTLFVDADEGRVLLTWRGHAKVREDDLVDVETLLIASEPLAEAPRAEAHYLGILEAFEKDPLGIEEHLEAWLPDRQREAARRVLRGEPPFEAPPADLPPAQAVAHMVRTMGGADEATAAEAQAGLEKAFAKAGPKADLEARLAEGLATMRAGLRGEDVAPAPKVSLSDAMAKVAEKLQALKQAAAERNVPVPGLERIEASLANPAFRRFDPAYTPPGGPPRPPLPEPGPGVDCSGRNLRGEDLSGRNLEGANLTGAILSGAKLREARLQGARLERAMLDRADLDGANLDGADLTEANLMNASARGASLRGASLRRCISSGMSLAGAVLDGASAEMSMFDKVDLTGVRARRVRFRKVIVEDGALEGADFSEAELVECYFLRCRARGLVARGASIPRTSFAGSDLAGAVFARARGDRSIWQGATLDGTDFTLAVLPHAHLFGVVATGAKFYGANLKGSRFYRAVLKDVDMERANLFGADFTHSSLNGTRFVDANLYDAKLLGSSGAGTDFRGANLRRALFEQP